MNIDNEKNKIKKLHTHLVSIRLNLKDQILLIIILISN